MKHSKNNQITTARIIDNDWRCEYMAQLGFSNRAIRGHLGLSDYQIQKRLKKAEIKRVDYRDAINPVGKEVVRRLDRVAEARLVQHIERYLLK